jgi:Clp protease
MTALGRKLVAGTDNFYVLLKPGGSIQSGIALYNFLRAIPATVTTHNVGNVDSIGNAVFLAADERLACPLLGGEADMLSVEQLFIPRIQNLRLSKSLPTLQVSQGRDIWHQGTEPC